METLDEGGLSKGKIRDRTYRFDTNGSTFRFQIVRHPSAFKLGYVKDKII